jgi:hypothetical protein
MAGARGILAHTTLLAALTLAVPAEASFVRMEHGQRPAPETIFAVAVEESFGALVTAWLHVPVRDAARCWPMALDRFVEEEFEALLRVYGLG